MSVNSILWFFGATEPGIIPCFSQAKIVPFCMFGHLLWKMHVPKTTLLNASSKTEKTKSYLYKYLAMF